MLENKQSREIADSPLFMISRTYDRRSETIRFVWRKIRFAFAVLRSVDIRNAMAGRLPAVSLVRRLRSQALESRGRKKLRKGGAKPMKSLARVNLCRLGVRCQLRRRSGE